MENTDQNPAANAALTVEEARLEAAREKARQKRKTLEEDYNVKMPGANIYGYDDLDVIMEGIANENPELNRLCDELRKNPEAREKLKKDLLELCKKLDERNNQNAVGAQQP